MLNIYEKLLRFIEDRMYEISQNVYKLYNQILDELIRTGEIISVFSDAIEEQIEANYKGEAFEIVETVFNKSEEEFCESLMVYLLQSLERVRLEH